MSHPLSRADGHSRTADTTSEPYSVTCAAVLLETGEEVFPTHWMFVPFSIDHYNEKNPLLYDDMSDTDPYADEVEK